MNVSFHCYWPFLKYVRSTVVFFAEFCELCRGRIRACSESLCSWSCPILLRLQLFSDTPFQTLWVFSSMILSLSMSLCCTISRSAPGPHILGSSWICVSPSTSIFELTELLAGMSAVSCVQCHCVVCVWLCGLGLWKICVVLQGSWTATSTPAETTVRRSISTWPVPPVTKSSWWSMRSTVGWGPGDVCLDITESSVVPSTCWLSSTAGETATHSSLSLIPRLHDEAGSTSWLYERWSSQVVEQLRECLRYYTIQMTS